MIGLKIFQIVCLLLLYKVGNMTSFLLTGKCLAASPCTCSSSTVYCQGKNLATVPEFTPTDEHMSSIDIRLYSNHLVTIPAHAFSNISSANATRIQLLMYSNKISSINTNAFAGIENSTYYIDLHYNNLTTIPAALKQLHALHYLNLQNNPLRSLDASTMSSIGRSLTSFLIDIDQFTTWPIELHFLRQLSTLQIDKIPFPRLDDSAFHGLESSLRTLTISNSKLETLPNALCHLVHLQTLTFNYNHEVNSISALPCHVTSVTSLTLDSNNLQEFPDIHKTFPHVTSLDLQNNQLRFIDTDLIPFHSNITSLIMNSNQFTRIPTAVKKLKSLTSLHMTHNKLITIEDCDLLGLNALASLYLYNNPLEYISPHAFKTNTHLDELELDATQLGKVPRAVMSIPHLRTMFLSGKPVQCTCDMSYLKPWNVTSVNLYGKCESSTETLKEFILQSLPKCQSR